MNLQTKILLLIVGLVLICYFFCTEKIPQGPERIEVLKVKLLTKDNHLDYAQENNWDNRFKLPPKKIAMADYENLSQWRVSFLIWIYNDFDEAIEGSKWIVIKVNLWSPDPGETWNAQLVYADTVTSRHLTIPPADSLTLYTGNQLIWEQKDTEGKSIHQTNSFVPIWIDCTEYDSIVRGTKPLEIIPLRDCDTLILAPVDTVVAYQQPKTIYAQAEVQLFKNYHVVKSDTVQFRIHYFFPADGFYPKFWCIEGRRNIGDPPCPFGFP